ncbi:hypothetical protein RUM43_009121 [Polyplax serrata]|uniref:Large ribosomal subunit protein uL3m n=1 Tax=Polyplax serrata TaxID=468196 RepID=A0AAN8RU68_POLSC
MESKSGTPLQNRQKFRAPTPKRRTPPWQVKQDRVVRKLHVVHKYDEMLTSENKEFIQQFITDTYGPQTEEYGLKTYKHTPLKQEPLLRGTWFEDCRRSGLIGIKIGVVPQWYTNGKRFETTMIQILDNHVIKYYPPEKFVVNKKKYAKRFLKEGQLGCLVVGAVNCDPQMFTREYNGLFTEAGVMPKKLLTRFPIHPCAAMQPGTPLYAAHFKVGDVVDVTGSTIYRGFQGVMKRWGFHGMPASHGVTKTHRRPGNIGAGGEKARVWPGTKMPGVMGNKMRTLRGLTIWKIDHKYNVLYVSGQNIPGEVNSFVYVHDTVLPRRRLKESPRFPTYYPEDYEENPLPEEEYHPKVFNFSDPTIMFEEEKVVAKKK